MAGGKSEKRSDSALYRLWMNNKAKQDKAEPRDKEQLPTTQPTDSGDLLSPVETEGVVLSGLETSGGAAATATLETASPEATPLDRDFLQILWRSWSGARSAGKEYLPQSLISHGANAGFAEDSEGIAAFLNNQQPLAELLCGRLGEADASAIDAQIHVYVACDHLRAWVFITPPFGGGREADMRDVLAALQENGVVYGLLEQSIRRALEQHQYLYLIDAACGTPSESGSDGEMIECLARHNTMERSRGVDELEEFQNQVFFQDVAVGTVLYRTTPPTEGKDGVDVFGTKLNGRMGRAARLPRIPNTQLSADGTELISTIAGTVSFSNNQFVVEKLLVINKNVDTASGDVNFDGDIQINGDVCEGRSVTATGSVTVRGMAEIAYITAGRDIRITKGMNGNQEGWLRAGGTVTSKYLENCSVQAGGLVQANSIICSDVVSDDEIRAEGGKGVIIGGSCTAFRHITAVGIGAKSHRPTLIVLGSTPHLLQQQMELEREKELVQAELSAAEKDIRYMTGLAANQLSEERKKLQAHLRLQKPILMLRLRKLKTQLAEIMEQIENVGACRISCSSLYPAVKIMIGSAVLNVEEEHRFCTVHYSKAEARIVIDVS